MGAVEALNGARAAGVGITVDGDALVLQASAPTPAAVLDAFSRHKLDIITLLQSEKNGWTEEGISWAELKALGLNRLFREQGKTGEPGRITAAIVRHGEQSKFNRR
jgi:hypothetical protein